MTELTDDATTPPLQLAQRFDALRILLTCGTGGVGKTTVAAALGLAAAQRGRRVLVMTIDPARRLADAMGLTSLGNEPQRVWQATRDGFLDCMMLDAKRTFDRVIERYAPSAEVAQRILHNKLYVQLSSAITGSQEYMAMEQLYQHTLDAHYDLIILDTPPSQHALDFFTAPQRMTRALTDSMLKLLLKPSLVAGRWGARLFARSTTTLLRMFGSITGAEMLQEMVELLTGATELFTGFEQRAQAVQKMLRDESTGILLVTVPSEDQLRDARHFLQEARASHMHLEGILFNRVTPQFDEAAVTTPSADDAMHSALRTALTQLHARLLDARTREQQLIAQYTEALQPPLPIGQLPLQTRPIHRLEDVMAVADLLCGR